MGYVLSNSGTPSVTDGCKDDISSVTDNGAGDSTLNFLEPFQRTCFPFITPAGGTGAIGTITTAAAGSARVKTSDEAGSATDMNAHVLVIGHDSAETNSIAPNWSTVRAGRFRPRLVTFSFNSSGTLTSGKYQVTVSPSTSTFTITFNRPFASAPVVIATCTGATAGVAKVTSSAVNQIVIDTFDAAGSGSARGCHVFVLGWDCAEYGRGHRVELLTPQLRPRLIVAEVTFTAGVPAVSAGTSSTVSDDNTGLFTLTFPTTHATFKRAPEVIACGDGTTISNVISSSTTATQIQVFSNAGVAADPGKVYVAALGYDSADEF